MSTRGKLVIKPHKSEILTEFSTLIEDIVSSRIDEYEITVLDDCVFLEYWYFGISPRKSATSMAILNALGDSEWVSASYISYNDTSDRGTAWFFEPHSEMDDLVSYTPEDMISLYLGFQNDDDIDMSEDENSLDEYHSENREVATVVECVEYTPFENIESLRSELRDNGLPSDLNLL